MTATGVGAAARSMESAETEGTSWVFQEAVAKPVQARSEQSFLRFLDAAEYLLEDRSWTALKVQDVVTAAHGSVGSFYNRFEDKLALLRCLETRLSADFETAVLALVAECGRHEELLADADGIIISLFMRFCEQRAGVIRALDLVRRMDLLAGGQVLATTGSAEPAHTSPSSVAASVTGAGTSFDSVLRQLAEALAGNPACLDAAPKGDIERALLETFWLVREHLLYGSPPKELGDLHRTLRQHFHARLFPAAAGKD